VGQPVSDGERGGERGIEGERKSSEGEGEGEGKRERASEREREREGGAVRVRESAESAHQTECLHAPGRVEGVETPNLQHTLSPAHVLLTRKNHAPINAADSVVVMIDHCHQQ